MKFLRGCLGVTKRDRLHEEIRTCLEIYKSGEYKEAWNDHVKRMEEARIPKQILSHNPKVRRKAGRPRIRWTDQTQRIERSNT